MYHQLVYLLGRKIGGERNQKCMLHIYAIKGDIDANTVYCFGWTDMQRTRATLKRRRCTFCFQNWRNSSEAATSAISGPFVIGLWDGGSGQRPKALWTVLRTSPGGGSMQPSQIPLLNSGTAKGKDF